MTTQQRNNLYLLDKNVTSVIEEFIKKYEELTNKKFDKSKDITDFDLQTLREKGSAILVERYEKLKGIDLPTVLLDPFFLIVEGIYSQQNWNRMEETGVLSDDLDDNAKQERANYELSVLNRFFVNASVGIGADIVKDSLIEMLDSNDEFLIGQKKCLIDMVTINQFIREKIEEGKELGKTPDTSFDDAVDEILNKTQNLFNNNMGVVYQLLISLAILKDKYAHEVTKIRSISDNPRKEFKSKNFFFDTYFIYRLLRRRDDMACLNQELVNRNLKPNLIVRIMSFDEGLVNLIDKYFDIRHARIEVTNTTEGTLSRIVITASKELQEKPYWNKISYLFTKQA